MHLSLGIEDITWTALTIADAAIILKDAVAAQERSSPAGGMVCLLVRNQIAQPTLLSVVDVDIDV